jgi:heme/copper-type cytochrome/quinol oxidase subunit 1
MRVIDFILRIIIGFTNLAFGLLKLFGMHMTNSNIDISKVKEINSTETVFWFFGHSGLYIWTIGLVQVISGILTLIPKTNLIGTILSLTIFINISLINFSFHFGALITIYILFTSTICIYLLYRDKHKLIGLLK